jgi:hypothetical protein
MLLAAGDKVLVAHRRLYEADHPRLFVGTVVAYEAGFVKIEGWSWVREPVRGEIRKKPDRRTKLISIASPALICYQLPQAVDIERLELKPGPQNQVVFTDGADFSMDLTDRNASLRMGSAA